MVFAAMESAHALMDTRATIARSLLTLAKELFATMVGHVRVAGAFASMGSQEPDVKFHPIHAETSSATMAEIVITACVPVSMVSRESIVKFHLIHVKESTVAMAELVIWAIVFASMDIVESIVKLHPIHVGMLFASTKVYATPGLATA